MAVEGFSNVQFAYPAPPLAPQMSGEPPNDYSSPPRHPARIHHIASLLGPIRWELGPPAAHSLRTACRGAGTRGCLGPLFGVVAGVGELPGVLPTRWTDDRCRGVVPRLRRRPQSLHGGRQEPGRQRRIRQARPGPDVLEDLARPADAGRYLSHHLLDEALQWRMDTNSHFHAGPPLSQPCSRPLRTLRSNPARDSSSGRDAHSATQHLGVLR